MIIKFEIIQNDYTLRNAFMLSDDNTFEIRYELMARF